MLDGIKGKIQEKKLLINERKLQKQEEKKEAYDKHLCLKCRQPLPASYKYHTCEACKNERQEKINMAKNLAPAAVSIVIGVIANVKGGSKK